MLKFPKPTRRPKRKRPRDEAHLRHIRSLPCCVPGCRTGLPIQAHHIRTAGNSGTGLKPSDRECVPACMEHHAEYHRVGRLTFEATYKIDMTAIIQSLAVRPPVDLL